jgi:hypothetical protein
MSGNVPIESRTLTTVALTNVSWRSVGSGERQIIATCYLRLSAMDGSDEGPVAEVSVRVPISEAAAVADAERALLQRSHEVLTRLATFSVDELHQRYTGAG